MKGLIIKEFYGEGKGLLVLYIALAIFNIILAFTPMTQMMLFLFWINIHFLILYPAMSLSKDTGNGFHICADTLPVSKFEIIISKFKVSWIMAIFPVAFTFAGMLIHFGIYSGANIAEDLKGVLFALETGIICNSLSQILMIKKINAGSYFNAFFVGAGYSISLIAYVIFNGFENQGIILLIFGIIAVVSYVFSYFKCIDIYKKGVIQ